MLAVRLVREGVTGAFGAQLRSMLAAAGKRRLVAFAGGLGVTVALQSSTATALIAASLAGRGLMATATGLAIMLGADVGTTLVPQLLSFGHGWIGPLLLAAGVSIRYGARVGRWRELGTAVIGVGLLLLALRLIVAATAPLEHSRLLADIVEPMADEPLIALVLGAGLAWLMHSSLAVVLLVMSLAATAAVPVPLAFALVLGANIGAGVPPVAMTAKHGAAARRITLGNLSLRIMGGAAALAALEPMGALVQAIEPGAARQVADFHTAFNLALAVIFLPLAGPIGRLAGRLIPDDQPGEAADRPRYLDRGILAMPSEALAAAARETMRMGDLVEIMLRRSIDVLRNDDAVLLQDITRMDDAVDRLHEAIKLYLAEVSRAPMSETESRRYVEILTFTINLEHIGDIIDKSLMELAAKKIRERVSFSAEGLREIGDIHAKVLQNMQLALNVFMTFDLGLARRLLGEKTMLREAELAAMDHHFARLRAGRRETIDTTSLHLDVIRDLRRINSHLTSAAYPILEEAGALQPSRLR